MKNYYHYQTTTAVIAFNDYVAMDAIIMHGDRNKVNKDISSSVFAMSYLRYMISRWHL